MPPSTTSGEATPATESSSKAEVAGDRTWRMWLLRGTDRFSFRCDKSRLTHHSEAPRAINTHSIIGISERPYFSMQPP
jgi:hypothetical protein